MDARKYRAELAELREKHLVLIKSLLGKTALALSKLELDEVTLGEVTNAVRLMNNIVGQLGTPTGQQKAPVENPLSGLRVVGVKQKGGTSA